MSHSILEGAFLALYFTIFIHRNDMLQNPNNSIFKPLKTAVLMDLSFFLKRYNTLFSNLTPEDIAKRIKDYAYKSVGKNNDCLYRIYIYDCYSLDKDVTRPVSKTQLNLKNTEMYKFRTELLKCLKQQPYCAVRLGSFDSNMIQWKFKNYKTLKKILNNTMPVSDLSDEHFTLDIKQKGVDMKIGLDMATIANKKQVEKIILITADSDFIPAIKLARKEGIIVQLDPMQNSHIKQELLEHLDLLSSIFPKRKTSLS